MFEDCSDGHGQWDLGRVRRSGSQNRASVVVPIQPASRSPTVRQSIERDVILFSGALFGPAPALAALVPRQEYLNRPPYGALGCLRLHRVHYPQQHSLQQL